MGNSKSFPRNWYPTLPVWLVKQVTHETGEAIRELAPTAVVLVPDFARVYPLAEVAAPVVGFVGREEIRDGGGRGVHVR